MARRMSLLRHHGINLVFDVGANEGQWARQLRVLGYRGRIVSFEPLGTPFDKLERARRGDPLWVAERLAVGETPGEASMNVAGNSVSSSFLDATAAHLAVAPESTIVGRETVRVERLETLVERHQREGERLFVKADTQGFEGAVVESARSAINRIQGFQLELSLVPLYRGETLFAEMVALLAARGFTLMAIEPGICEPVSGQQLQVDGLFFRAL